MSNHQQDSNELNQQEDGQDGSQEDGASYMMEGYTPLNFNMNALAMDDDDISDEGDTIFSGYYQMAPENRRNGVKAYAGEFTSQFNTDADEEESESDSDGLVPVDFEALAEQALRGLDDEHRVTLERSESDQVHASAAPIASTQTATQTATAVETQEGEECAAVEESGGEYASSDETLTFEAVFPSVEMPPENLNEKIAAAPRKFPAARMNTTKNTKAQVKRTEETNTHAIQEAMKAIRQTAPKFASTLDEHASASSIAAAYKSAASSSYNAIIESTCRAIAARQDSLNPEQILSSHPIIPFGPLAAFRRNTPKARGAAHNLSRSATLSEAIYRLWPLICFRKRMTMCDNVWSSSDQQQSTNDTKKLSIHIIGSDGIECSSGDSVRNSVGAFVRWLDAALKSGALSDSFYGEMSNNNSGISLTIEFSGPCMPDAMLGKSIDMLPQQASSTSKGLAEATCVFRRCEYDNSSDYADLTIAFNAGIWGYDSWQPTLLSMMRKPSTTSNEDAANTNGTLFVITAYTCEECEDDEEVITQLVKDEVAANCHQIWEAEANLFASRKLRITESASQGRQYFENGAWQAWLFA